MLFASLLLGLGLLAGALVLALRLTDQAPVRGGALMLLLLLAGTGGISYVVWLFFLHA